MHSYLFSSEASSVRHLTVLIIFATTQIGSSIENGEFKLVFPNLVDTNGQVVSNRIQDLGTLRPFVYPKFKAFGKNFTLYLNQNHRLLGSEFVIEKITRSVEAEDVFSKSVGRMENEASCHYVGTVKGHANSSVAVNTCNGLNGIIVLNSEEYYIEPVSVHADFRSSEGAPHALYKRSWLNLPDDVNDDLLVSFDESWKKDEPLPYPVGHDDFSLIIEERPGARRGHRSLHPAASIETLVVADRTMLDFHGELHIKDYILTVMNMVSNIFRDPSIGKPINVAIVRLVIIGKEGSDSFEVSYSAKSTLKSFCLWQKRQNFEDHQHPYHHDVAVLFTRKDICGVGNFPCGSIGMAMQGGMCSTSYSCSIVQDTGLNTAFTVAQMLGHNIGLLPLRRTTCRSSSSGSYIMSTLRLRSPYTNRFQWSSCSRNHLTKLLKQRTGRCLLDAVKKRKHNVTLPGQIYNVDRQCRFIHGGNASFCRSSFEDACKTLWCTKDFHKSGCVTNRQPAAEGTLCDKEGLKWCIGGSCVPRLSKPLPIDGKWGNWSQWTQCSRTCGGGVQKRTRECNSPRPSFKGKSCLGKRIEHRICNTKPCKANSLNFRDVQCAAFNDKPYRGRLYKWKPFHSKDKQCALICKAERYRFYVTMRNNVEDGTHCSPGSNDRCIEGQCKRVGCDFNIGSLVKRDICGVCGGNGSTCKLVNEDFKKKHGIGYQTVTYIPSGSTSINIVEKRASRNFIAIETTLGENILNTGYTIERPGSYNRLNTIVKYHRIGMLEKIHIAGPISKDIKVMVLFQADVALLSLQYAIQNDQNRPFHSSERYIWRHDSTVWFPCPVTCGYGLQAGKFKCLDLLTARLVDKKRCSKSVKPYLVKACDNLPPCEKRELKPEWKTSLWGPCSATCGNGTKKRMVGCTRTGSNVVIDSNICKSKKPRDVKKCNRAKCPEETGIWVFSQWNPCSVTCGEGVRRRSVQCLALTGKRLDPSRCPTVRRPPESARCLLPCVKWVPGQWSRCPRNCEGEQRRCVVCVNMHTFTQSAGCRDSDKPITERRCPKPRCN